MSRVLSRLYVLQLGHGGCVMTASPDVDRHPFAFREAYWEINSLRTYYPLPAKAGVESQLAYVDASFVLEAQ